MLLLGTSTLSPELSFPFTKEWFIGFIIADCDVCFHICVVVGFGLYYLHLPCKSVTVPKMAPTLPACFLQATGGYLSLFPQPASL